MSLPSTAIVDPQIQTKYELTKQTGSDIGGTAPAEYGFIKLIPGRPTAVLYYVSGEEGKYQDWLSAIKGPVLPNNGNLQLDFDLTLDNNFRILAQALEYDTIVCFEGYNYLFGFQIIPKLNQVQISASDQINWGTPFVADLSGLIPNKQSHFTFNYKFDTNTKIYSFLSFSIDGKVFQTPSGQQNLTAIQKNWTDHVIMQVQMDTNGQVGLFSQIIDNVCYAWY